MALTQISTQGIKDGTITGSDLATNVDLVDNQKLRLGTGNDLQIYHDGSNSFISDAGTGGLKILGSAVYIKNVNDHDMVEAFSGGAVSLFHNNSKKLETTSGGALVTGDFFLNDNGKLTLGTGGDLKIFHNGTHNYIYSYNGNLELRHAVGGSDEPFLKAIPNGAVELYHNSSKKLETTSSGVKFTGTLEAVDNQSILLGSSNDLRIRHTGSHSEITDEGTGNLRLGSNQTEIRSADLGEVQAKFIDDGGVELFYDNSKKFETTSGGAKVTGFLNVTTGIHIPDGGNNDSSITIGSDNDLRLFHDGSNSKIVESGTGGLIVQTNNFNVDNAGGTKNILTGIDGGAVELYHDGSLKFETTSGGVYITGAAVFPDGSSNGIQIGNSSDLQIYHSGTQSYVTDQGTGNLNLQGTSKVVIGNAAHNENMAQFFADGAVELYHNNSKKFETKSFGALVSGNVDATGNFVIPNDTGKFLAGASNDLQIYHDGTDSYLQNNTGTLRINNDGSDLVISTDNNIHIRTNGTEEAVKAIANGAVELYFNNSGPKLATTANGVNLGGGTCTFNDNGKLSLGTGGDLQIYHTGTESFIDDVGTGRLRIRGNDAVHIRSQAENEEMAVFNRNGSVDLYHNNNKKLATTSSGITVTGTVTETSDIALKFNIQPLTNTLEKIQQITGYKYNLVDSISPSMGVIAQDVEKVFPELVHGSEGKKTLQYSGLIGVLVEAMKDLSAKVAALEAS